MSQQEDDLRALAKIMDFLRAVSIILVVAHLYWYCYEAIKLWGAEHRCGGQDTDEFPSHGGTIWKYALHQALCAGTDGAFLFGYKGRERGVYHLVEDMGIHGRRLCLFLPQLVDTCLATAHRGEYGSLYFYDNRRLYLSADGGTLYEPTLEEQPDGGCLQSGERILYAGDKAFGKRVLGQSADSFLLPKKVE